MSLTGMEAIGRVTLVDPDAGTILVWQRGTTTLSVSRYGIYIIRGLNHDGMWVRGEEVSTFDSREPLLPLAKEWFRNFHDESLPPIAPALEASLFREGQARLKLTS